MATHCPRYTLREFSIHRAINKCTFYDHHQLVLWWVATRQEAKSHSLIDNSFGRRPVAFRRVSWSVSGVVAKILECVYYYKNGVGSCFGALWVAKFTYPEQLAITIATAGSSSALSALLHNFLVTLPAPGHHWHYSNIHLLDLIEVQRRREFSTQSLEEQDFQLHQHDGAGKRFYCYMCTNILRTYGTITVLLPFSFAIIKF